MQISHKFFAAVTACALLLMVGAGFGQSSDSPSLGDLARQQRQRHAKAAQSKDGKAPKIFTNADLPAHSDDADHSNDSATQSNDAGKAPLPVPASEAKPGSEEMREQIRVQKTQIADLQKQIDDLNASIRFAPGNCVRGCEQWNERQQQKQQQAEQMQAQLAEQKKQLEEMQESARKQGFGSSVYDP